MLSIIRNWWWGGDPDQPNQLSQLTPREIYIVQKSWSSVYADSGKYGMEFFKRLFRKDPSSKLLFKTIRNMSEEEFSNSFQFKAHVINLMSSLDSAVVNLHQPEVVVAIMNKLGETHGKRRVEQSQFGALKDIIVDILRDDLKLDENALISWKKFIDFIYRHIFEKM